MRAVFGRKGSPDVFLYAFDVLELDGRDLRAQSWDVRRALLTQLLDRCQDGLRLSEHVEDTDGAVVFRQACVMGLDLPRFGVEPGAPIATFVKRLTCRACGSLSVRAFRSDC